MNGYSMTYVVASGLVEWSKDNTCTCIYMEMRFCSNWTHHSTTTTAAM